MERPESEEEEVVRANARGGEWGSWHWAIWAVSSGPTSQRQTSIITATATRAARTRSDAVRWIRIGRLSSHADLKQMNSRLVDRLVV